MFQNADKLINLLDRMIRMGGNNWRLEDVSKSRWVPRNSPLDLDLALLMARTSPDLTVDEAMGIIDKLLLEGTLSDSVVVDLDEKLKDLVPIIVDNEADEQEGDEGEGDGNPQAVSVTEGMTDAEKDLLALVLGDSLLDGTNSDQARDNDGGWNNPDLDDRTPKGALKALENVLRRLMIESDGEEAEGRLDYTGVTERLLTKQGGFHRERKVERGRKVVLILPDVSGSCADVCGTTMNIATRLSRDNDKILVLPHSNGWYSKEESSQVHPSWAGKIPDTMNSPSEWQDWLEASGREVSWVFALGDHDAERLYHMLAGLPSLNGVLWVNPMRRNTPSLTVDKPHKRIAYVRTGDAAHDVAKGLTKALQSFLREK